MAEFSSYHWFEIGVRLVLFGMFKALERAELHPFVRVIQPEEAWLYKFPMAKTSTVPASYLLILVVLSSVGVVLVGYHGRWRLGFIALLVPSLAIPLVGIVTHALKLAVGRPRPDFWNRCYGENYLYAKYCPTPNCENPDSKKVLDGRKSFPSGHASLAFSSLGFLSLYIWGQLGTFSRSGRGVAWRLLLGLLPLFAATLVGVSRITDYRHHYDDVIAGSLLGLGVVYVVYRQYFPALSSPNSHTPFLLLRKGEREGEEEEEEESTLSGVGVDGVSQNLYSDQEKEEVPQTSDEFYFVNRHGKKQGQ